MIIRLIKHAGIFVGLWLLSAVLVSGCHCVIYGQSVSQPRPIYVKSAPPAVKQEVKPATPSNDHIWVAGSWDWNEVDDEWEWTEGSWEVPPAEAQVWQDPSYEDHGDGVWVYVPGYWSETNETGESDGGKITGKPGSVATMKPDPVVGAPTDSDDKVTPGPMSTVPPGQVTVMTDDEKKPGGVGPRPGDGVGPIPGGVSPQPGATKDKPGILKPGVVSPRPGKKDKAKPGILKPGKAMPKEEKRPGGVSPRPGKKDKAKPGILKPGKVRPKKEKRPGGVSPRPGKKDKAKPGVLKPGKVRPQKEKPQKEKPGTVGVGKITKPTKVRPGKKGKDFKASPQIKKPKEPQTKPPLKKTPQLKGNLSVKGNSRARPRSGKLCNKSAACNCNAKCDKGETQKTCIDCKPKTR